MNDAVILECVFVLNPRTAERARRLACAVLLLRQGHSRKEVGAMLRERFVIGRVAAWRVVDMAADMAGSEGR